MSGPVLVAIGLIFTWIGLVVGISFIEAPIKFRAPGVTLQIGLGIGRLVFRVTNTVEGLLAAGLAGAVILAMPAPVVLVPSAAAVFVLAAQLVFVRPRLTRRSNAVLAGESDAVRSHAHHAYVALEGAKLVALLVGGIAALTTTTVS
ncbi:MAG: hypothetical protein KIT69_02865 [Propionibacteriaceae bacterium]|nr:hypothetical protein [Actinomycetota bacterium]MCW5951185.1 hypothetical protein [Propionibacteriaceae bacterium]